MQMVIPYQIPFLAKETGPELTAGVYAATDFWWTLEDKYPLAKMFVDAFYKKFNYRPEWGANNAYMSFAIWARMVSEAGDLLPTGRHQTVRERRDLSIDRRRRALPQGGPPARTSRGHCLKGKEPKDMKNNEDYWEVLEVVAGEPLMQKPDAFGCNLGYYI